MFILKVHTTEHGDMISVCDSSLLGKMFEHNDTVLDISADFYNGKETEIDDIVSAISRCHTAVIMGNNIISELIEKEVIKKDSIKSVGGQEYAMIFRL